MTFITSVIVVPTRPCNIHPVMSNDIKIIAQQLSHFCEYQVEIIKNGMKEPFALATKAKQFELGRYILLN